MKRDDPDVFSPETTKSGAPGAYRPALPPGPTSAWSAPGVIGALEPLLTETRRERLKTTLERRLASVTLVLDNPHDPHNGSAVLRSCDAFGLQRLHVLCEHEPFLTSRQVAKGTQRWVDVFEHATSERLLDSLGNEGFRIVVTHPCGNLSLDDLPSLERVALVLGNEHSGVSAKLTEAAHDSVAIEMRGFVESLNVSVSAALILQAATKGRSGDLTTPERENIYARWLRNSVPRADEILTALEAH